MKTEVEDPDLVDTFTADSRGRIRLGKRFADREVKVAVEDRGQKEDTNDE